MYEGDVCGVVDEQVRSAKVWYFRYPCVPKQIEPPVSCEQLEHNLF